MKRLTSILIAFVFAVSGFIATAHAQGTVTASEMTAPQASTTTTTQNGEKILTGEEIRKLISGKKVYFDWTPSQSSPKRLRYDFFENGTFRLYGGGATEGTGTWTIQNGITGEVLCTKYNSYAREDLRCVPVSFKNNTFYLGTSPFIWP